MTLKNKLEAVTVFSKSEYKSKFIYLDKRVLNEIIDLTMLHLEQMSFIRNGNSDSLPLF